uniref:HAD family hydrolase n=1 Tax=Anaerobutyricum hallii TaxID=39488 RepID=UPI003FEE8117
MAFGDNLNDISMIQSAGKGYAVNTAREETKKAADEVIPGYAENGVLEVLKTFL